jgi:hypothetical protein
LALDGGEWSASHPSHFTPKERDPGIHQIGGWVGPRAVLDMVVKRKIPSPHQESNPRTPIVWPVAQSYTISYIFMVLYLIKYRDSLLLPLLLGIFGAGICNRPQIQLLLDMFTSCTLCKECTERKTN